MHIYDLSHRLTNESPVYPGKDKPAFTPAASIQKDGYRETHLAFDSHLGTHIDAPAHMLENSITLDQMGVDSFSGKAVVISVPEGMRFIAKDFLLQFINEIKTIDFVLFKTGWSKHWGTAEYFKDFPTLTTEAVYTLLTFQLKGIGFDAISADPVESTTWENHLAIFNKGMIIIENLIFPDNIPSQGGKFYCFPLPYANADGSPVRAVLETQ